MAGKGFDESYKTHEFVVEIGGLSSPGITKVTGLSDGEVEAIEQPDGGDNITHKISSGIIKYDDLTLERNMDGTGQDDYFREWFETMFTIDGSGTGSIDNRRSGSILVKNHKVTVMRFSFHDAWIKSSKFSDLDAGQSGLMKQTIVLAVERMRRESV